MGHASIGITVSVYGSWLPPEDTSALDRYAERLLPVTAHTPAYKSPSEGSKE